MRAIDEYNEVELRLSDLQGKRDTLFTEREQLLERIDQYEQLKRDAFMEAYTSINANFKEIFHELSDGMQTGKGKGQAMIQAFGLIESPYVIMADGDGTYLAREARSLLKPLLEGSADHVMPFWSADDPEVELDAGCKCSFNILGR